MAKLELPGNCSDCHWLKEGKCTMVWEGEEAQVIEKPDETWCWQWNK